MNVSDYPRVAQDPPEAATMSVAAAARELGWTEKQVRAALHRGTLRGFKPGLSHWTVLRASVDAVQRDGAPGFVPGELADKFKRFARIQLEKLVLEAEQGKLAQEIEDALRDASPCRDGGPR